jgi:hypothetical protein
MLYFTAFKFGISTNFVRALTRFQLEHHSGYHITVEWDISDYQHSRLIFQGDLRTRPFIPSYHCRPRHSSADFPEKGKAGRKSSLRIHGTGALAVPQDQPKPVR